MTEFAPRKEAAYARSWAVLTGGSCLSDADIVRVSIRDPDRFGEIFDRYADGMRAHGMLAASTVTEPSVVGVLLAGGPAKVRPSGCSASAITTAAVMAAG